jgi:hypothetical protein
MLLATMLDVLQIWRAILELRVSTSGATPVQYSATSRLVVPSRVDDDFGIIISNSFSAAT